MPPRSHVLPPAQTESAREARKAFLCELCGKGYARMQDFENHESSYDHQHRKRMKDMKQLLKDPNASAKAKAAERANDKSGMQTISLASFGGNKGGLDYSGTKKKPVFTNVAQSKDTQSSSSLSISLGGMLDVKDPATATLDNDPSGAVRNGWYQDRYDPRRITGCDTDCPSCHGKDTAIQL